MRIENRKARYEYNIIERYEAGVSLLGPEVKSIREGKVSLSDSFCKILGDEIFVIGLHIAHYESSRNSIDPKRNRKLLLHRDEINRIIGKVSEKGFTLIPLALYLNKRGKVKIELAICRGKKKYEKREAIKMRDLEREIRAQNI
ncbi:MAG: SsrA-binding protein SmpB [bacterium]|nr:SsrA-binding protein SmpB [bacterium]